MKTYFMNLNKQSNEFRRGFKHNFHETTFLTPTLCVHCNKLLWGLIRQGHKCKDCGLVVHECCKDSAVAECRRKRPTATAASSFSSWLSSPRTISASSTGSSNGSVTTPRKGIFLNYSMKKRAR
uniref:Phorbol-ester/DAG-type domain-containing protein n=1 Tax=Panagrolaimus davidi TaxID=227884 RepID=A0A914QMX5_9BILA